MTQLHRTGQTLLLLFLSAAVTAWAGAEETSLRPQYSDGMTPYEIYMTALDFAPASGSFEKVYTQKIQSVLHTENGIWHIRNDTKTEDKEIWQDNIVTGWHYHHYEVHTGGKEPPVTIEYDTYFRDGWVYKTGYGERVKYPADPGRFDGVTDLSALTRYTGQEFPASMIASQKKTGRRLTFILDTDAINEQQREEGLPQTFIQAELEAELDENGELEYYSLTEVTVDSADSRDRTTARRELRFVKRGGVTIAYPTDLDSYPEKRE